MATEKKTGDGPVLPDGCVAIPVSAEQMSVPLRLCAVVRTEAEPAGGHLVVLREMIDARALLGCVVDAAGAVHRWVELWVQDPSQLSGALPTCLEALSNSILDGRWQRHFQAMELNDGVIRTGWETAHPLPTCFDLTRREPVHPVEGNSGSLWKLCQDEGLLSQRRLPGYGATLHRYLYVPALGAESPMVALADAPLGDNVRPFDEVFPAEAGTVWFNPGGGLLMVRNFSPVRLDDFLTVLGGGSAAGMLHGRLPLDLGGSARQLHDKDASAPGDGRIFLGAHGRAGRLIESLHLKLRLLGDAAAAVYQAVGLYQRPLLNLSADSFQVSLADRSVGLPFLWTARVSLADPGQAVALPVRTSDMQYYLRAASEGVSVYRPVDAGLVVNGRGAVRIRQVLPESGATVLEGTLITQERMAPGKNDLFWVRLNVAGERVDLYARLESQTALASGEWRFRTIGQRLGEKQAAALKAAQGVPMSDVPFELVPLLSTPVDLYSLAVLAVRTLLVNDQTTLPVALDELMSLARQAALTYEPAVDLGVRIRGIFEQDQRWFLALGPQRLMAEPFEPAEAFELIPAELWFDALAMIVRMLPGVGPDSTCRDFGDVPSGGIQRAFERVTADLDSLLLRTRSLIVIDWRFNREVHSVIRGYLKGTAGAAKQ